MRKLMLCGLLGLLLVLPAGCVYDDYDYGYPPPSGYGGGYYHRGYPPPPPPVDAEPVFRPLPPAPP